MRQSFERAERLHLGVLPHAFGPVLLVAALTAVILFGSLASEASRIAQASER